MCQWRGGVGGYETTPLCVVVSYIPPQYFSPTNLVDTLFFLYINLVDSYTHCMDELQKQKLLKSLYNKPGITNQMPQDSAYVQAIREEDNIMNPERGYIAPSTGKWVPPFQSSGYDSELEKYSVQFYKKPSSELNKQELLNLLMNLDAAKKEVGLAKPDLVI